MLRLLSPLERDRRDSYRRDIDRDRFTLGATMVRMLLGAFAGADPADLDIDRACLTCDRQHGRPVLLGSDLTVSVSHAGDRIGVAVGRVPALGLDVEPSSTPTDVASLLRAVLSPDELHPDGLSSPDENAAAAHFLDYWTRKEAVLKATGDGLAVPMTDVRVTGPTVNGPDLPPALISFRGRPDLPARTTLVTLNPGDGHIAVLAAIDALDLIVTEHTASELIARFVTDIDAR